MRDITILMTGCGAQYSVAQVNCLRNNGERVVHLIGTDMKDDVSMHPFFDSFYEVPSASDPSYPNIILEIAKKEHVDVVIPTMSFELIPLLEIKDRFEAAGIKLSVSNRESIEITTNKYKFYSFLKENNLKVPKFQAIHFADELVPACKAVGYPEKPVCVKATELCGSRGIRLIDPQISRFDVLFGQKPNSMYTTMDELYHTLKEREEMPEMMAMEYLPGLEGSVDLVADHGEILYMAYRESNVNLASIPQEATLVRNEEAYEIARSVISALKLDGNADLDFKNDAEGHPVLMEVNPRVAATMQIFKEGGINLLYLRVKQLLGEKLPELEPKYGIKMKRRYLEMFSEV